MGHCYSLQFTIVHSPVFQSLAFEFTICYTLDGREMGSVSTLEISGFKASFYDHVGKDASLPMTPGQDLQPPQTNCPDLAGQFLDIAEGLVTSQNLDSGIVSHMRKKLDNLEEALNEKLEEEPKDVDNMAEIGIGAGIEKSPIPPERFSQNDLLSSGKGLPEDDPYTQLVENSGPRVIYFDGIWSRNAATNSSRGSIDYEKRYRWCTVAAFDCTIEENAGQYIRLRTRSSYAMPNPSDVIAEIDRILEEKTMYAELRSILLTRSTTKVINPSTGQSAQYIVSRGLSDYLSHHTPEQGLGGWHTDRLGQGLSHLGGIHLTRNRLPRRKASLLRALSLASIAGILVAGAHLPGGLRTIAGVLATSAAVVNIPMHMHSEYPALRWSLFAFCLVAYAAFVGFLWDSLKGKGKRQPAYLFFAIFTGVGAIGTTLVADKVDDTVKSVLAFGPLALTLIAGLFYMPFRYGFSIGADPTGMIEMQVQPGQLRRHQTS